MINYLKDLFNKLIAQNNKNAQYFDLSNFSVKELREKNFKVQVLHSRYSEADFDRIVSKTRDNKYKLAFLNSMRYFRESNRQIIPSSRGGKTEILVTSPEGVNYRGIAICSVTDGFCKKTGIKIALQRLVKVG